ncbi:hypothetical protein DAT36_04985 [Photobacterium phosphoreum]|nr:hypothetical protein DAT36_04985 [Photobacterium phosphoreum]
MLDKLMIKLQLVCEMLQKRLGINIDSQYDVLFLFDPKNILTNHDLNQKQGQMAPKKNALFY